MYPYAWHRSKIKWSHLYTWKAGYQWRTWDWIPYEQHVSLDITKLALSNQRPNYSSGPLFCLFVNSMLSQPSRNNQIDSSLPTPSFTTLKRSLLWKSAWERTVDLHLVMPHPSPVKSSHPIGKKPCSRIPFAGTHQNNGTITEPFSPAFGPNIRTAALSQQCLFFVYSYPSINFFFTPLQNTSLSLPQPNPLLPFTKIIHPYAQGNPILMQGKMSTGLRLYNLPFLLFLFQCPLKPFSCPPVPITLYNSCPISPCSPKARLFSGST